MPPPLPPNQFMPPPLPPNHLIATEPIGACIDRMVNPSRHRHNTRRKGRRDEAPSLAPSASPSVASAEREASASSPPSSPPTTPPVPSLPPTANPSPEDTAAAADDADAAALLTAGSARASSASNATGDAASAPASAPATAGSRPADGSLDGKDIRLHPAKMLLRFIRYYDPEKDLPFVAFLAAIGHADFAPVLTTYRAAADNASTLADLNVSWAEDEDHSPLLGFGADDGKHFVVHTARKIPRSASGTASRHAGLIIAQHGDVGAGATGGSSSTSWMLPLIARLPLGHAGLCTYGWPHRRTDWRRRRQRRPTAAAESELEEGDEEPQEVEPKRPRLAAPSKLEEEHDYVAELGKYALRASQRFHRLGFSSFVDETRGRSNNITDTVVGNISHPASGLLDDLRRSGAPVEFSSPALDADQLKEALEYGSHGSCLRGLDFIGQETMDFVRKGFYGVLPYDDVKELSQLHLSRSMKLRVGQARPLVCIAFLTLTKQGFHRAKSGASRNAS